MARRWLSMEVDERLLDALRGAAACDGVAPDEVDEEALRRYFGLRGLALLDDIDNFQRAQALAAPEGDELLAAVVSEVRAYRDERRRAAG